MTYVENIKKQINKYEVAEPIYISVLAKNLAQEYNLPIQKATANVSVILKRIINNNCIPELRFYSKGIYYKTRTNVFGDLRIDKQKIIADKYLNNNNGYETGLSFMHRLSLTTQLPAYKTYASNNADNCLRFNTKYEIYVCPAKTLITSDNIRYLQILDAVEMLPKTPIDADEPYLIISKYIYDNNLDYELLLYIAQCFYSKNVIIDLAFVAGRSKYESSFRYRRVQNDN